MCQQDWFLLRSVRGGSVPGLSPSCSWFAGKFLHFLAHRSITWISAFIFIWSYPYVYVSLSRFCLFKRKWVLMDQGPTLSRKAFSFSFLSFFFFSCIFLFFSQKSSKRYSMDLSHNNYPFI